MANNSQATRASLFSYPSDSIGDVHQQLHKDNAQIRAAGQYFLARCGQTERFQSSLELFMRKSQDVITNPGLQTLGSEGTWSDGADAPEQVSVRDIQIHGLAINMAVDQLATRWDISCTDQRSRYCFRQALMNNLDEHPGAITYVHDVDILSSTNMFHVGNHGQPSLCSSSSPLPKVCYKS